MGTLADAKAPLAANRPAAFWCLLRTPVAAPQWEAAGRAARGCLAGLPEATQTTDLPDTIGGILDEGQFGPGHWQLSPRKRLYYEVRRYLPASGRALLQRLSAKQARAGSMLRWPIEDRYVRFQYETARCLLTQSGQTSVPYIHFWPGGRRFAFVLTHDVDTARGQRFVRQVAALEERLGFRSSFNFVPEGYTVDRGLLAELRERGFEVGVHGLKHDGKLFSSEETFRARARRINDYLAAWQAAGFRSPMTHRNPAWMQALEIEYDSSFFDTDPFEPMPGGTMTIWPFFMGRFVELPYTLAQDHTLLRSLGETTPRLWLDKVEFIRRHCGMALVNTHPDYLLNPAYLAVYEQFLVRMRELGPAPQGPSAQGEYWHALPVEVARWWRQRADAVATWDGSRWAIPGLPGATIGRLTLEEAGTLALEPGPVQSNESRPAQRVDATTV